MPDFWLNIVACLNVMFTLVGVIVVFGAVTRFIREAIWPRKNEVSTVTFTAEHGLDVGDEIEVEGGTTMHVQAVIGERDIAVLLPEDSKVTPFDSTTPIRTARPFKFLLHGTKYWQCPECDTLVKEKESCCGINQDGFVDTVN